MSLCRSSLPANGNRLKSIWIFLVESVSNTVLSRYTCQFSINYIWSDITRHTFRELLRVKILYKNNVIKHLLFNENFILRELSIKFLSIVVSVIQCDFLIKPPVVNCCLILKWIFSRADLTVPVYRLLMS